MLRVGLTGELGSGKSTVARMFAERGAIVFSSDDMGRAMMQPGEAVYGAIVDKFGPEVVLPDGSLDRRTLAQMAFDPQQPRVEELNAIVHPAVLAEQERRIAEIAPNQPNAIVVVESALLFTTKWGGDGESWGRRFDRVVLVTAPDAAKVERFVERVAGGRDATPAEREALRADGRRRLAAQRVSPAGAEGVLLIENNQTLGELEVTVDRVWKRLRFEADELPARN